MYLISFNIHFKKFTNMKKVVAVFLLMFGTCFSAFSETPIKLSKEFKIEIKVNNTAELKDVNWEKIENSLNKVDSDYKKRLVVIVEEYKTIKVKDCETWSKFTIEAKGSKSAKKIVKRTKMIVKSLLKE